MKKQTIGIIEILVASLIFGFIPILVRFGKNLGPYNLSVFRIVVATICLLLFFLIFRKNIAPIKIEKLKLLLFGALHGFVILGYFISINYLSVASAVLLMYSSSIWMIVFSYFILKEKITKRTWIALIIAIGGVIFVLQPKTLFIKESLIGSLAGLAAGIGFGLVYVLSKTFKTYDKVSLTFWQNLIAIPFVLPLLFIQFPTTLVTQDWIIILLLGSVFTALPFVLVFNGLQKVSGQIGGIMILLDIIFPIAFALFIFKEIPSIEAIIGGILIIIGSYISATQDNSQVENPA